MDPYLCRVCLGTNGSISIFDDQDNMRHCVRLMKCVDITISEDDGLPNLICCSCVDELKVSYDFILKCEASDKTLRQYNLIKDESLDTTDFDPRLEIKQEEYEKDLTSLEDVFSGQDYSYQKLSDEKVRKKRGPKKKNKSSPIQCVTCGLMVNCPSALEIHMRVHTGEKPYACTKCNACFKTKGSLKRHHETNHDMARERKFTCETCGSSFYRKNDIITHMRIHTNEKPYSCQFCSAGFRQIASLIRHQRVHTGDKPYACNICDKRFADKTLVNKHLAVHSDERKYTCHICSKSVKSKNALTTHIRTHSNDKQNICNFCGVAFAIKGNLTTHMKRMHSERSGQCSVCSKTFSNLEEHMRIHTGEKPYVCAVCGQNFAKKRSLAYHFVFKHENAAKYKCSIGDCNRTFPTAQMLEFHLMKHTNNTPFVCPHCSRGFFRMSDLTRHLKVSHMEVQSKSIKTE